MRENCPSFAAPAPIPSARVLGAADGPSVAPATWFLEPPVVRSFFGEVLSASDPDEHPASRPPTTDTASTAFNPDTRTTTPITCKGKPYLSAWMGVRINGASIH
ncbi:hypothetical protein GCM10010319_21270 [Streptomyces blastmyceticus]|uniref:Uncharacterized protein n=1 Tax=Streptomyces blastmyceticus TaxID=68180 RepID=A0ABN0WRC1_9ACTN